MVYSSPMTNTEQPVTCRCGDPLSVHIGGKPCTFGRNDGTTVWHLPISQWALDMGTDDPLARFESYNC